MRAWIVFLKSLREMLRDKWMLGLTLVFAPFFVLLYWLFLGGGSTTYRVVVINQDGGAVRADGSELRGGDQVVRAIQDVTYADGSPLLKTLSASDRAEAEPLLRDRKAVAFILIPQDFSRQLEAMRRGDLSSTAQITFGGDVSNPYYMVGVNLALTAVDRTVQSATGRTPLVTYHEEPLGISAARTEFEVYVPGTLIFAVIMLIFLASMSVAREIESGALRRLQLTPMTSFDLLGGITAALVLVGVIAITLATLLAVWLGFRSQGPLLAALLVGAVASLSVIGVGMVVASFAPTVSQAFVVANFPMAMMMFFSGVVFPMPPVVLFNVGGQAVGLYDILPSTHAVNALNKILTLGAGLGDVMYELTALLALSAVYFAIGAWLFQRRYLTKP